jgi:putative Flp pilus-assembly TadE/G-like protein
MTFPFRNLDVVGDQRGAALVMFAVFAPVAILLAAFAIDAGNWFWHKRHLQLQADAGALAAAQNFQQCFTNPSAANAAITTSAQQYSGIAGAPLYNTQIGETSSNEVHELINSQKYYNQSEPVDTTAVEKPPCEAGMVDLKVTETNLPWYWQALSSVPFINAHARVEILQETKGSGVEPLAVSETAPVAAAAYFVNEDNGDAVLAKATLTKQETNKEGQDVWISSPTEVTINHPHIGVVVALSGNKNDTQCGDAYVQCFDESATTGPSLLHIQGWSSSGSGTGSYKAPIAREVTLQPVTCSDPYFAAGGKGCSIAITAKLDLGATPNPAGVTVSASVGGGSATPMTYSGTSQKWTVSGVAVPNEGSNRVDLKVECDPKAANSVCAAEKKTVSTTLEDVQRAYAAGASSGPIAGAWVSEPGAQEPVPGSEDADSYEECASCAHKLVVTVDVAGSIGNASGFKDPLRQLRFEGQQGVRVSCPPPAKQSGSEYRTRLEQGCPGTYAVNTSNPSCTANTQPYDCLTVGLTGKDTGPTLQGIQERIENHPPSGDRYYCPNNWQDNNNGGVPIIPSNDSRIIQVFIIPYGTIDSSGRSLLGNEEVPIENFATFYVTGFPGDGCATDQKTGNAEIVGHFMKYINTVNNDEGGEKCVANSLGECVAVLTR